MAERKRKETSQENYWRNKLDWWVGNHLRVSNHAIERAREYGPSSFEDLTNRDIGRRIAGAIYNPADKVKILDPVVDTTYQVAAPFFYDDKLIGYAVISPDQEETDIIVCKTMLDPQSWQLYSMNNCIPVWYLVFQDRVGASGKA